MWIRGQSKQKKIHKWKIQTYKSSKLKNRKSQICAPYMKVRYSRVQFFLNEICDEDVAKFNWRRHIRNEWRYNIIFHSIQYLVWLKLTKIGLKKNSLWIHLMFGTFDYRLVLWSTTLSTVFAFKIFVWVCIFLFCFLRLLKQFNRHFNQASTNVTLFNLLFIIYGGYDTFEHIFLRVNSYR